MKTRFLLVILFVVAAAVVGSSILADKPEQPCSPNPQEACSASKCPLAEVAAKCCSAESASKCCSAASGAKCCSEASASAPCGEGGCSTAKPCCADNCPVAGTGQACCEAACLNERCCPASKSCCAEKCPVAGDSQAGCEAASPDKKCCSAKRVALTCPVSGDPASDPVWAAYNGGKVYFRCGGCKAKFEKDSEEYAVKANHQLILTGQATQKACPLSGKPVKCDAKVGVAGVQVAFCGNGCKTMVENAGAEKQLEICFNDQAFQKAFAIKKEEPQKEDQKEKDSK